MYLNSDYQKKALKNCTEQNGFITLKTLLTPQGSN